MKKNTLFISDLHLQAAAPKVAAAFMRFLKTDALQADALYILGDFFEMWLGDDDDTPFHREIKAALKALSDQHVPIYIMRGNRDFLLGQRFMRDVGAQLLPDPTVMSLYGKDILLTHGDRLCTDDLAHQRFLKFAYNRPLRWLFLHLPLVLRYWAGNYSRKISQQRNKTLSMDIMDVNQQAVVDQFKRFGIDLMIHGHTHRPNVHAVQVDEKLAQRVVLGAWDMRPCVLIYDASGQFELQAIEVKHD